MTEAYLLGVDAGTSVVKAALFTESGQEIETARFRTPVLTPQPTWTETDMREVWQMTTSAIRAVLTQAHVAPEAVRAVGVTGQMVGAWLIDAHGEPVRNAILWSDGRAQGIIDRYIREYPDFHARIFESSGSAMQQGCTLPVLRWLAEYEPATLAHARHVLCCKDWIVYKLTGSIQLDPSEASVMPGDVRGMTYSEAMIDLFGLREHRHLFPPVVSAHTVVGELTAQAAEQTGLRARTPIVCGAGDVVASAIGAGAVSPGRAISLLGTNYLNCLVLAQPIFEPRGVGVMFCLPNRAWLRSMINVSGTTSLDWCIDQLFAEEKACARSTHELFTHLEALAQQSSLGARGVLYLPYLSAQGITAPLHEPAARAEFSGLTLEHTRNDLLRAVYEGLALSIRDGYACIPAQIDDIWLTGGTSRSAFFCQMVADCTGKQVVLPAGSEFGAKGAALLASVGIGWYTSIEEACAAVTTIARKYDPDPALRPAYDALFAHYTALREALVPVWRAADDRVE